MYHFVEIMSFPPNESDSQILCGAIKKEGISATNNPFLVDCPDCLKKIKKCTICNAPVPIENISENKEALFLTCSMHKLEAENMTLAFFKRYPDYTKWQQIPKLEFDAFVKGNR